MVQTNYKFVFSVLTKIVCLIGCVYQSFKISEYYFSYETITNVKYENENKIDFPGITVAYSKLSQLSSDYEEFNIIKSVNQQEYLEFQLNGTIGEQRNLFQKLPSRIQHCFCYDMDFRNLLFCSDKFSNTIRKSFSGNLYGISLFKQYLNEPDQRFIIKNSLNSFVNFILVYMVINKSKVNMSKDIKNDILFIQLHNRKEFVFEPNLRGSLQVNISKADIVRITYRKTVVKYLFSPRSYPCSVGETKEQCIYHCKRDSFISKFNSYPYSYMIPINKDKNSKLNFSSIA